MLEVALIGSIWIDCIVADSYFDPLAFIWLFVALWRTVSYLYMCCDGIYKRKVFFYSLVLTTILEAAMFVTLNIGLQ